MALLEAVAITVSVAAASHIQKVKRVDNKHSNKNNNRLTKTAIGDVGTGNCDGYGETHTENGTTTNTTTTTAIVMTTTTLCVSNYISFIIIIILTFNDFFTLF